MHNALQGADINLSEIKTSIFEEVNFENALRNRIDHDIVLVHDPQPLAMIDHFSKKCPWLWRCHVELSNPHGPTWEYLAGFIKKYDAVILSSKEYQQNLPIPQLVFMPAIDPFSIKNKELTETEIDDRIRSAHSRQFFGCGDRLVGCIPEARYFSPGKRPYSSILKASNTPWTDCAYMAGSGRCCGLRASRARGGISSSGHAASYGESKANCNQGLA